MRSIGLFFQNGEEAVGIIAHDAVHASGGQNAHVCRRVHRPADHLQIALARLLEKIRTDQVAADGDLAGADFYGFVERVVGRGTGKGPYRRILDVIWTELSIGRVLGYTVDDILPEPRGWIVIADLLG